MTKLSLAQRHVIDQMKEGWELAKYPRRRGGRPHCWLQSSTIRNERVSLTAFNGLITQELIAYESTNGYKPEIYVLTEKGRENEGNLS